MDSPRQPRPMSVFGNISSNWEEWKLSFDYYLFASGKDNATSLEKSKLFLQSIGRAGREVLDRLTLEHDDSNNFDVLVSTLDTYCDLTRNVYHERDLFFETYQRGETFDNFLNSLKKRSISCDFGPLRTSLILTQIIRGITDQRIRENIIKKNMNFVDAVLWCRAVEIAGWQAEGTCAEQVLKVLRWKHGPSCAPPAKRPNKHPAPMQRPSREQYAAMCARAQATGQPLPAHVFAHVNGKPTNLTGRGGRRHVISWMDAPDDLYFRATEAAKNARRSLSCGEVRRGARAPWRSMRGAGAGVGLAAGAGAAVGGATAAAPAAAKAPQPQPQAQPNPAMHLVILD